MSRSRHAEADKLLKEAKLLLPSAVFGRSDLETHYWASQGSMAFSRGKYAEARQSVEKAREILSRSVFQLNPDLIALDVTLANIYDRLGMHKEAAELFRKAAEALNAIKGNERREIANCLNGLAASLYAQHKYHDAKNSFKLALDEMDGIGKGRSLEAATSYNGIGLVYEALRLFHWGETELRKCLNNGRRRSPRITLLSRP